MFDSFIRDIKHQFRYGNMVNRIIILNVLIFIFVNLVRIVMVFVQGQAPPPGYEPFLHFFTFSSNLTYDLTHPWVIFTHMFLHDGMWHIFWNMMLLYWFGRIVGDLIGDSKVLPIYLLGGLTGGFVYFAVANFSTIWGIGHFALGASAAVMAIIVAAATISPDYNIHLMFLGRVKLKYIAGILVFIDLIAISWNTNSGGSFAHLGGAFMGWFFVYQLKDGNDFSIWINNVLDKIMNLLKKPGRKKKSKMRVVYQNPKVKKQKKKAFSSKRSGGNHVSDIDDQTYQEKLDRILDKIKISGYDGLTKEEKDFLFDASKRK